MRRPVPLVLAIPALLALAQPACGRSSRSSPQPPVVTNVIPSSGDNSADTQISIIGRRFRRAFNVNLDDPASTPLQSIQFVSDTSIVATVPAGVQPGFWNVQVTNPAGTNTASTPKFQVTAAGTPAPTLTAISPSTGPATAPTSVTIDGTNFIGTVTAWLEDPATTSLTGVSVVSSSQITATVPAGIDPGTWVLRVAADGGTTTTSGVTFTVATTPAPTLAAVNPDTGPATAPTSVTIDGTNFIGTVTAWLEDPATTSLTGVSVVSSSQITATVPAGIDPGTWVLRVAADGGTTTTTTVTFAVTTTPAPTVTAITPSTGPAISPTDVTIDGTNFIGTVSARLDDPAMTALTNVIAVSQGQITATVPAGVAEGIHEVRVTADGGTSAVAGVTFEVTGVYTGPAVYVTLTENGEVLVVNLSTRVPEMAIPVELEPSDIAIRPDETEILVANQASNTVSVIDPSTNTVVDTILVGAGPAAIDYSPSGHEAYVANSATSNVSVIDTDPLSGTYRTVVATIPVVAEPGELEFRRPQGDEVWVLCSGPSLDSNPDPVDVIDVAARTTTTIANVGISPFGVTFDATGNTAYVANAGNPNALVSGDIAELDVATRTVTANTALLAPGQPFAFSFSTEIARVPGSDVAYVNDLVSADTILLWDTAAGTQISPGAGIVLSSTGAAVGWGRFAFAPASGMAFDMTALQPSTGSPVTYTLFAIDVATEQPVSPSLQLGSSQQTPYATSIAVKEN